MAIDRMPGSQAVEERLSCLEQRLERLERDNSALKELVGWSDDPATRRALRSNVVMVIGSVGWWSGALGTAETLKLGAALYLTGSEAQAFGLVAWVMGCSIAAGPAEKIAKSIAVRFTKRFQTNSIPIT